MVRGGYGGACLRARWQSRLCSHDKRLLGGVAFDVPRWPFRITFAAHSEVASHFLHARKQRCKKIQISICGNDKGRRITSINCYAEKVGSRFPGLRVHREWQSISSCVRSHDKPLSIELPDVFMRLTTSVHSVRGLPSRPAHAYLVQPGFSNVVVPFHIRVNLRAARLIDPEYHSSFLEFFFSSLIPLFPSSSDSHHRNWRKLPVGPSFDSRERNLSASYGPPNERFTVIFPQLSLLAR